MATAFILKIKKSQTLLCIKRGIYVKLTKFGGK